MELTKLGTHLMDVLGGEERQSYQEVPMCSSRARRLEEEHIFTGGR